MISLTSRATITIYIWVILFAGCANTPTNNAEVCVERTLNVDIVRTDEKNHRFFIADSELKALDIKNKLNQIEKCFINNPWQPDWALSVFSEAKFAGYKDEESIIPYHKDNKWANSYIIEYDHSTKSLIKNPAINPEKLIP